MFIQFSDDDQHIRQWSKYPFIGGTEYAPVKPMLWRLGSLIQKSRGSNWRGTICGTYSTTMTPIGYAVESSREPGNVQIYPEAALMGWDGE